MKRIAQAVPQAGDELIPQYRGISLVEQTCLTRGQPFVCVDLKGDKFGEELEHPDRLWCLQLGRPRVDSAESAEKRTVAERDRHRDIALEAVHGWRRVPTIDLILSHVIDDDGFPALPDFVADGCLDLQLATGLETKRNFVADAARDPVVFGDPCYGREAHVIGDRSCARCRSARLVCRDCEVSGSVVGRMSPLRLPPWSSHAHGGLACYNTTHRARVSVIGTTIRRARGPRPSGFNSICTHIRWGK